MTKFQWNSHTNQLQHLQIHKCLMLSEFTLLQSEVDKVNQYLSDHHWTVSAIHNHWFDENPRLIFLHAQKQDNLDNVLSEVRGALQQTNCGCV
jgi:Domain of Unknown Function (DUF1259)